MSHSGPSPLSPSPPFSVQRGHVKRKMRKGFGSQTPCILWDMDKLFNSYLPQFSSQYNKEPCLPLRVLLWRINKIKYGNPGPAQWKGLNITFPWTPQEMLSQMEPYKKKVNGFHLVHTLSTQWWNGQPLTRRALSQSKGHEAAPSPCP